DEKSVLWQRAWHVRTDHNLLLASRYPIHDARTLPGETLGVSGAIAWYALETPGGRLNVFNVHLASPREGLEAVTASLRTGPARLDTNTALRWHESEVASSWAGRVPGPVLLAGDFNLPVDSPIYRRFWSGYANAFATAGLGWGYTKFTHWFGARI